LRRNEWGGREGGGLASEVERDDPVEAAGATAVLEVPGTPKVVLIFILDVPTVQELHRGLVLSRQSTMHQEEEEDEGTKRCGDQIHGEEIEGPPVKEYYF